MANGAFPCPERPELRHAGLATSSAIAELERASRVACSDLSGDFCILTAPSLDNGLHIWWILII